MKKTLLVLLAFSINYCAFSQPVIGVPISNSSPLSGLVKGTMISGKTYTVSGDIIVAKGDTLLLQNGVTVCMQNSYTIVVQGVLISLGTQTHPNSFTVCSGPDKINTITQGENPATDLAWNGGKGWWPGIECDTTCKLLCLKWTHIDFTGAGLTQNEPFYGGTPNSSSYGIFFQNPNGDFIMEDSWMYGSVSDGVRINEGRINIMRNTFEKIGYIGGDCLNAKSGTIGDMAYNLFVGTCTNGTKASNKGSLAYCTVNMYNNTYIDGGYRQASAGRGGSIDYEQGANGKAYNNLIVNCKFGFRIIGPEPNAASIPNADTTNCFYGNNYGYGDSASVVDQLYPVGYITKPSAYVVPTSSATGYVYSNAPNGANAYNASALAAANNPMFVNFPLPEPEIQHLYDIGYVGTFSFVPKLGSPVLAKGYTGFSALNASKVTNSFFAATATPPGVDIGCFQINGTGNQHDINNKNAIEEGHVITNSISVYPNPSVGIFTISNESNDDGKIEVFDVNGRQVDAFKISSMMKQTLNYTTLANGVYFMHYASANKTQNVRLIILK